jgi:hypothetical protein
MAADRLHRLMATFLKRAVRSWKAGRTPAARKKLTRTNLCTRNTGHPSLPVHAWSVIRVSTKSKSARGIHANSRHGVNLRVNSSRGVGEFWPPTTTSSGVRVTCQLHTELTTTIDSVLNDYHDGMKHRTTDCDDVVVFNQLLTSLPIFTYQPNALCIQYCSRLVYLTSHD